MLNEVITLEQEKGFRRWLTGNVFYMGLTSLFNDWGHEMATAVLPFFLMVELGTGPEILGLVEGLSDGASSFTKSFSGYLSDKMGKRKPPMNLGYALTAIMVPLIGAATSWPQVITLRVLGWAGRGARGPPRDALMADSVPQIDRGKAFGFNRALDTIGAFLGPATALFLMTFLSYRQIFAISAIPAIISFLIVLLLVKEITKKHATGNKIEEVKKINLGFVDSLKALPRSFKLFLGGVGVFGLGNFANSLFTLRAQEVLAPTLGAAQASVVAVGLYTLCNIVYAGACFPVGALSDKMSKRGILAVGYFLSAITCLGTAFLTSDFLMLIPIFVLAGFFTAITDTVEGAAASDLIPPELRGTGFGLLQTVNGIGDFISSAVVGVLWTLISPIAAFGYAAVLSAAGGILLLSLTRGQSQSS